ncbi:hypothetical protein I302_104304 [Kwoniella bestiolae CBS 10118]|uniref:Extracellular membrane protein CFEM domain-containing protein n=1 Tax=Kwoniella bestiolae CBS 10118 TaxID=1296100 RepID=A0A1B9GAX6_9TREE|nr:hypothetical protein I302_03011 [Kwoniella bestiolae CBS 10118]OCF28160.1 hypothetical protein I302_03011 [Kwoniella bestiolae CBS 10118]
MNRFTQFVSLLCSFYILPLVLGSAASQFRLEVNKHASECFVECHSRIEYTIEIPGTGSNGFPWIKQNCQQEAWKNLMSACLPLVCSSAPDVAYAVEYGENWCHRAGVEVKIPLPETYLNGVNGSYFKSEEYLASSSDPNSEIRAGPVLIGLLSAFGVLTLFL